MYLSYRSKDAKADPFEALGVGESLQEREREAERSAERGIERGVSCIGVGLFIFISRLSLLSVSLILHSSSFISHPSFPILYSHLRSLYLQVRHRQRDPPTTVHALKEMTRQWLGHHSIGESGIAGGGG